MNKKLISNVMQGNIFLLTHKCGNMFLKQIFKTNIINRNLKNFNYIEIPKKFNRETLLIKNFKNIRCRNFSILKSLNLINDFGFDKSRTKFFCLTRHPASLFKSAAIFGLRGSEKWMRKKKQGIFNGNSYYSALHECNNFDEQLILCMKFWGLQQKCIENWFNNIYILRQKGFNVTHINSVKLWEDKEYLEKFHQEICHNGFYMNFDLLFKASPLTMKKLRKHSTGQFRVDPYVGYSNLALSFYNKHFKYYEIMLGY